MIHFEHTLPLSALIGTLVAALVLGWWSAWRFLPRDKGSALLALLYLGVLGALGWCLLLPGRKDSVTHLLKPRFLVALDTSGSMALTPGGQVPSRWEAATQALQLPWTQSVSAQCEVEVFPFSASLAQGIPLLEAAKLKPEGSSTLLRDALKQLADRHAGVNVVGALLLSDGIDTREAVDDWTRDERPFPIYALRLEPPGEWQKEPDLRIDAMTTSRRVPMGWKTECKVRISGQGTRGAPVSVKLFQDGALVQEKPTQIPDEGGEREIVFELEHPKTGTFSYRAHLPPLPGEGNVQDNEFVLSVQATDAGNRVLYVEGAPRWDYKFLRRTLLAQTNITPVIFFAGPDGKPQGGVPAGSLTAEMTPAELSLIKIAILGDLTAKELGETRAKNLAKFVEDGGSLVILGGLRGWGAEGLLQTSLRQVLPVRGANTQPLQADKPFPVRLTDTARAHPAFAGDPELWQIVPPVLSVFSGVTLTPGAEVLVEAVTPAGPQPLIATQRFGQGKAAVVLTDSLWRWQLGPESSKSQPYQRFWTQLITWLLPEEEELRKDHLDLFADRSQLFLGEEILLNARFGGTDSTPAESLECVIQAPDGREVPYQMSPRLVTTASGQAFPGFALPFSAQVPGAYKAYATAKIGGRVLKSEPVSYFVKPYSPETMPRPIHAGGLKAVADSSGGKFFESASELDGALGSLEFASQEEETARFQSLWRTWPVVGALMLLLTLSWGVRKMKNIP